MSDVLHRLAGLGLDVRGVPPTMAVVVRVGGREVGVTCDHSDERSLKLVAETAGPDAPPDDSLLAAAARTAAGDTAFGVRGDQLTATRHLVDPTTGGAYDAVFELAKVVVALRAALEAAAAPAADAPAAADEGADNGGPAGSTPQASDAAGL